MSQPRDSHLASSSARAGRLSKLPSGSVETLENRVLLSSSYTTAPGANGVFNVRNLPGAFSPSSSDSADFRNGPLAKLGTELGGLYYLYRQFQHQVDAHGAGFQVPHILGSLNVRDNQSVLVTLRTKGNLQDLIDRVHQLDGEIYDRSAAYHLVDAYVPISQLSSLSASAAVATINATHKPQVQVGKAENQADLGLNAASMRNAFGVDGTGVKVGVISDSFSSTAGGYQDSLDSGDLPPGVEVLTDDSGTDEGRAMLELIHDIAPGAKLAFSAGGNTILSMSRSINALAVAGCNVIVDDLGFATESYFSQSVIEQAVQHVVQDLGVTYFSAAGNEDFQSWTQQAHWVTASDGRTLLNFNPSGNVQTRMRLTFGNFGQIWMQWDDPYNGIVGTPTTDLDINFYDPTSGAQITGLENLSFETVGGGMVGFSGIGGHDDNFQTGVPLEIADISQGLGLPEMDVEIQVSQRMEGTQLPQFVKMISFDGTLQSEQFPADHSTTIGHSAGQYTIGVGAVPFTNTKPFQGSQTVESEPFSSAGPKLEVLKADGTRLPKPLKLLKPDIASVDGVNTSFFGEDVNSDTGQDPDSDNLPNFYGTSAAAPNAAAVAALLLSLAPKATPAEIKTALIASAKQNQINGSKTGVWNQQSGFGLIDAILAAHRLRPQMPFAQMQTFTDKTLVTGPDTITITFDRKVSGFNLTDLTLIRGATGGNLLGTGQTLTSTDGGQTYVLSGLAGLTKQRGTYNLTLTPAGASGIRDANGNAALPQKTQYFVTGKPTELRAQPVDGSEIDLTWNDNLTNETNYRLYRSTDPSFLGAKVVDLPKNTTMFKDKGLRQGITYYYRVRASLGNNNQEQTPSSNIVSSQTLTPAEVIVDNRSTRSITVHGSWRTETEGTEVFGPTYLVDGGTGKGSKSVSFTPHLPANGEYFVYVRNVPGSDRSSNTPVSVAGKSMTVDQRTGTGWKLLGQFKLVNGDSVVIGNSGTKGMVVADAVRFVKTNSSGLHSASVSSAGAAGAGAGTAAFKAPMTSASTIFSLVRAISEDDSKNLIA